MKNFKLYSIVLCLLFGTQVFAQLEVDHPIQLTGTGVNAKVSGIQSVTGEQDAVSAQTVQNGSLVYATTTGTGNNFFASISPGVTAYTAGMVVNFISNQKVNGPATLNVNNLGAKPIKKSINQDLQGCEIQNGQFVTVAYDGTNFQMLSIFSGVMPTTADAGSDSINIQGPSTTLSANAPISGTGNGVWTVDSGSGGTFSNAQSPTSTFTGIAGGVYILKWTISNSCAASADSIHVSFKRTQTFNYTGGQQTFTVPAGSTSVNITAYGAQGGTVGTKIGGLGGQAMGTLSVTPGQILYIYVGGQANGTTGGFNGGGNGYGSGAGGGGASDVRYGGSALGNRVIVAGGGGGVPYTSWSSTGGTGGGSSGGNGQGGAGGTGSGYDGNGGTQSAGGYGASTYSEQYSAQGSSGQGGNAGTANSGNGGGGGGYYGGGGGDAGPGGGGSGYTGGVSNASMQNGVQSGNGQIILNW